MKVTPLVFIVSLILQSWLFADLTWKFISSSPPRSSDSRALRVGSSDRQSSLSESYFKPWQRHITSVIHNTPTRHRDRQPLLGDLEQVSKETARDISLVLLTFSITLIWCAVLSSILHGKYMRNIERDINVIDIRDAMVQRTFSISRRKG